MAIKIKVGQIWESTIPSLLRIEIKSLTIARFDAPPGEFWVYAKELPAGVNFWLANTDSNGENSKWDSSWVLVQDVPEQIPSRELDGELDVSQKKAEKPCKNKWCGKMNDIGSKACWLCECENPTDYK